MKTIFGFLILASAQLAAQTGFAPSEGDCTGNTDVERLNNSAALEMSVALDRTDYMSFEVMSFAVSLRNTGSRSVEVYDPWQPGGIAFEVATGEPNRLQYQLADHAFAGVSRGCGGTSIWLRPGETVTRQIRSDQPLMDPAVPAIATHGAPPAPGSYQLAVNYRNHVFTAPFQVVRPQVEGFAGVKLRAPKGEYDQYVYGYILRMGESRYAAIAAKPSGRDQLSTGETAPTLGTYLRVAELSSDESLATLEEGENAQVSIKVRSATGMRTVRLKSE